MGWGVSREYQSVSLVSKKILLILLRIFVLVSKCSTVQNVNRNVYSFKVAYITPSTLLRILKKFSESSEF